MKCDRDLGWDVRMRYKWRHLVDKNVQNCRHMSSQIGVYCNTYNFWKFTKTWKTRKSAKFQIVIMLLCTKGPMILKDKIIWDNCKCFFGIKPSGFNDNPLDYDHPRIPLGFKFSLVQIFLKVNDARIIFYRNLHYFCNTSYLLFYDWRNSVLFTVVKDAFLLLLSDLNVGFIKMIILV